MKTIIQIVMMALAALALAACGMNEQSPDSSTGGTDVSTGTGAPVGMSECLSCHSDNYNPSSLINVVGDSAGSTGWLNGPHGNGNDKPNYGFYGNDSSECTPCHDQLDDGLTISAIYADTGVDIGMSNRPVIGCESCHGSGAGHYGTGQLEYARPDASRCGQCHDADFDHSESGDEIYEKYAASKHAGSAPGSHQNLNNFMAACSKCHTDEGAKLYMATPYFMLFGRPNITAGVTSVQCRTCHDPHEPDKYALDDTLDAFSNVVESGEFRTCTSCHTINGALHGEDSAYSWTGYSGSKRDDFDKNLVVAPFNAGEIIYDTHVDNPDTEFIEGYNIDKSDHRACSSCHDVHEAEVQPAHGGGGHEEHVSINLQWARSAHGGFIDDLKTAALANIALAGLLNSVAYDDTVSILNGSVINGTHILNSDGDVTEKDAGAWTHYDFKLPDSPYGPPGNGDRLACMRCHTSTGFRNFISGPAVYNAVDNDFSYETGQQREMLYCWGCHQSIADDLRGDKMDHATHTVKNQLVFNDVAPYDEPSARILSVGSVEGSIVCVSCHSGMNSGVSVTLVSDFTNTSAVSPHYLAAGGVLYGVVGYENSPAAGDYDNDPLGFLHNDLGFSQGSDNGPCVACHMKSNEGHIMEAAIANASGIIDIPAFENTCAVCHNDEAALISAMNTAKAGFQNAIEALKAALASNNVFYSSAYPYFYNAPYVEGWTEDGSCNTNMALKNWNAGGSNTYSWTMSPYPHCEYDYPQAVTGDSTLTEAKLGAAFNLTLLSHEPGAYAHNSKYAKRLLFDSIDALDNGNMDGVISLTPGSDAETYLNGGTRP
jgi:hypothetical protein